MCMACWANWGGRVGLVAALAPCCTLVERPDAPKVSFPLSRLLLSVHSAMYDFCFSPIYAVRGRGL